MSDNKISMLDIAKHPRGSPGVTIIVGHLAFTLMVILRLWKGWDFTLRLMMPMLAMAIYLMPTFFAFERPHPRRLAVACINIFLGWTVLGWLASLAMALKPNVGSEAPISPR